MVTSSNDIALRRAIGRSGFFTLAFGAIVGSGWVVVLGEWLRQAGPGGSALGFLLGGVVMVLVSLCYGELASRSSTAGGEFLYTLHTFGPFAAFLVGWFLTLAQISVCAFEGIALAWLFRVLAPNVALPTAYTVAGSPVTWDALIIGIGSALVVAVLHLRGATSAIRFQNIVTYSFIAVVIVLIANGVALGSLENLNPLTVSSNDESPLRGILWIFATSAYFLNGWQASLHAIEERRVDISIRTAIFFMVLAIAASSVFYACIILACSMAIPWTTLVTRELPAVAAFGSLGSSGFLGTVVLIAAIISLTKTWSACAWIGTRLLFAQSRHGLLPSAFSEVDPVHHVPRKAILFVSALSMLGVALGRSAIVPIVDTLAICVALSIILCLCVLLRRRQIDSQSPEFQVPGGLCTIWAAIVSATVMVGIALMQPMLSTGRIPVEWYFLASWGIIGSVVWIGTGRRRHTKKGLERSPAADRVDVQ